MLKTLLAPLLALTSFTPALADNALIVNASRIAAERAHSVASCLEKTWPGFHLNNLKIVYFTGTGQNFAVSGVDDRVTVVSDDKVPENQRSGFDFYELNGEHWMSVNTAKMKPTLGSTITDPFEYGTKLFRFALHEAFHFLGQKGWRSESTGRDTELPIRWEPRAYRAMTFKYLSMAMTDFPNSLPQLSKAAYWYRLWQEQFPNEVANTTDGLEGTARYVDVMAEALAQSGCGASDAELLPFLRKEVTEKNSGYFQGKFLALDNEGYALGSTAAILLRLTKPTAKWHAPIARGKTPVDILLGSVSAQKTELDPEVAGIFTKAADEAQKRADKDVGQLLQDIQLPSTVYINIPNGWHGGVSFSPKGFFHHTPTGLALMPMSDGMKFISDDGRSKVESKESAVFITNVNGICQTPSTWVLPVRAEHMKILSDGIAVNAPLAEGNLRGKIVRSPTGLNFFCADE